MAGSIFKFLTSKTFFKNLIFIGIFFIVVFLLVLLWLRIYTNHGQKLDLPEFMGMNVEEASSLAEDKSFKIIVNDSVHMIGEPGGKIIDQNPKAHSKVKENRKVYVTTTKFIPDKMMVRSLPTLYGREYERKRKELSFMDINSEIKDYIYDPGEPNHILEVYYKGELIIDKVGRKEDVELEKGGTLEFVLSKSQGGEMGIPDIVCMDFQSATFLIENLRLRIGEVIASETITDRNSAFIIAQTPGFDPEGTIQIGDEINLTISQEKPVNCN